MRNRNLKNEINVVPYIDVMLVLLVIFMVTAPMMTTSIVDLPSVNENANQPQQPPAPPIEVIIKDENTISVKNNKNNDEIILSDSKNSDELVNIINEFKTDENQAIVISGDKNIKYELVIEVMNTLQTNNFKKIGLLVQNKSANNNKK